MLIALCGGEHAMLQYVLTSEVTELKTRCAYIGGIRERKSIKTGKVEKLEPTYYNLSACEARQGVLVDVNSREDLLAVLNAYATRLAEIDGNESTGVNSRLRTDEDPSLERGIFCMTEEHRQYVAKVVRDLRLAVDVAVEPLFALAEAQYHNRYKRLYGE